jgi:hypothetical protein
VRVLDGRLPAAGGLVVVVRVVDLVFFVNVAFAAGAHPSCDNA